MTYHSIAKITLGAFLVALAGCKDWQQPNEPSPPPRSEPIAPPQVPQDTAPTAAVAATYLRLSPSFLPEAQRYVLYVDGTFGLQYDGCCDFRGSYLRADSVITFNFKAAGWLSTGVVSGDSLVVKYNNVMVGSDFEDGLYIRQ
jgi:hypothetical protein